MKFCYSCGKVSAGEPLFCGKCGRSFDVRLCPRLHRNSRWAKVCSQCGSHELSQTQPHVSFWWKALEVLIKGSVAVVLVLLSLLVVVGLLQQPKMRDELTALGILLGLLWWMWMQLPEWIRGMVQRLLKRKERNGER